MPDAPTAAPPSAARADRITDGRMAVIVFAGTFVLYLLTVCRWIYWEDAGELVTAARCLGIPHPPGHPLYAILGKLFCLIPVGHTAFRVNLMSAFFGALAAAVLHQAIAEFLRAAPPLHRRVAALAGSAAFALSSPLWNQAVVAETSTIYAAGTVLFLYLSLRLARARREGNDETATRLLTLLAFLLGAGAGAHPGFVLLVPAMTVFLLLAFRGIPGGSVAGAARAFAACGVVFLAGFSVFAYLPLRSHAHPPMNWGDPGTPANFYWVITAQQYRSNLGMSAAMPTFQTLMTGLSGTAGDLAGALPVWGWLLALPGLFETTIKRRAATRREWALPGAGAALLVTYLALSLNPAFIRAYLLPLVAAGAFLAGAGTLLFLRRLAPEGASAPGRMPAVALILLVPFAVELPPRYRMNDFSKLDYADRYGRELLDAVPPDGVLITGSANAVFIARYLQVCEGLRPDVAVITRNGLASRPNYLQQVARENTSLAVPLDRPSPAPPPTDNPLLARRNDILEELVRRNPGREFCWEGLENHQPFADRLVPAAWFFAIARTPAEARDPRHERGISLRDFADGVERNLRHDFHRDPLTRKFIANGFLNYARFFVREKRLREAVTAYHETLAIHPTWGVAHYELANLHMSSGDTDRALTHYRLALADAPLDPRFWVNYGLAWSKKGVPAEERRVYEMAVRLDPGEPLAHFNLGLMEEAADRPAEALRHYTVTARSDPRNVPALYALSRVLRKLNRPRDAVPRLLEIARIAIASRKFDDAGMVLREAVVLDPENAEARSLLATLDPIPPPGGTP